MLHEAKAPLLIPNASSPHPFASPEALAPALTFFVESVGGSCTFVDAVRALRGTDEARPSERDDQGWLTDAAAGLGVQIVAVSRSARQLTEVPPSERVSLVARAGEDWLAVVAGRGLRLRVTTLRSSGASSTWMDAPALAAAVGAPNADTPVNWYAAVEARPLSGISAPRDHGHHGMAPLTRLRALLRLDRDDLWVVLVYAVTVGLLSLATPIAVQALVNTVAFGALLQPIIVLTVLVLAVLGFAAMLRALQVRVVEALQQRIFVRVALDVANRLPRVPATALDRMYGPELVNRFFDVLTVQKTAATFLLDGIGLLLQAGIGLVVLAFYHPALLALDALLIVCVTVVFWPMGRGASATSIEESKSKYAVAAWLEEMARHPYLFRGEHGARHAAERAAELVRRYLGSRRRHFGIVLRQVQGLLWLQAFASAALLGLGGALVVARQLTLGQLVAAELIVTAVVASLVKLGKHLETFYDLVAAVDKLGHLADLPLEPTAGAVAFDAHHAGARVVVRDAGVALGGERAAVTGVSFELAPGARAVVTGASGSGKTTLAETVFGLRTPTEGSVEIDGMDTREAPPARLRDRAALLGPTLEIIDGSIAENIAVGRPDIGPREMWAALSAVGLADTVRALQERTATRLSPTGAPLSYGQARRLAMARALAGRPRLLLVDDALAGLDTATRRLVEATLCDPAAPWTLLVFTNEDDPFANRSDVVRVASLSRSTPSVEARR